MWGLLLGVAVILVIVFVFNSYQNKYQSLQGDIFNFAVVALLVFLILTLGAAYMDSNFNLLSFDGLADFFKFYMAWLGNFFSKGVNVAGYFIKQDWGLNATELVK